MTSREGPVFNNDRDKNKKIKERENNLFNLLVLLRLNRKYRELEDIIMGDRDRNRCHPVYYRYGREMDGMLFEDYDVKSYRVMADVETRWRLDNLRNAVKGVIDFNRVVDVSIKEWRFSVSRHINPDPIVGDVKYIELEVSSCLWDELLHTRKTLGFDNVRDCLKLTMKDYVLNRVSYIDELIQ